jgi:uncharacterized protein (TIGR02466 family)|tara:strand:+ start:59 stop:697 length:639 start_codon:yes stop_codon:yes gene_type:complete
MAEKNKINIVPLFASPLMQIQLDLDTDKLTELAFQMQDNDKKGIPDGINKGGWQSNNIIEENHEEFKKLKKEITQHLQLYHSTVFQGMKFKGNVTQSINNMWVIINEKHQYVDWHIHHNATLSGVFYIKHEGVESGDILFKHPEYPQMSALHWKKELVEVWNMTSGEILNITPNSNMLLIFPSWAEHKVELNLTDVPRISLSFNSILSQETK